MTKCILDDKRKGGCVSCSDRCAHAIAMHGLNGEGGRVGSANLPADYRHVTLANSKAKEGQTKAYEMIAKYVATFERQFETDAERIKSLYLWSASPGTGKTTTASAILNEWIAVSYVGALKRGIQPVQSPAVFFDVNEFQTDYNLATMTNDEVAIKRIGDRIKRVQHAPFAVLDDLGVRGSTEAFASYLHAVINYRVTNALPTIYTSNLPMEEMKQIFTPRLYDRIRDQCQSVHFEGESKRGRR